MVLAAAPIAPSARAAPQPSPAATTAAGIACPAAATVPLAPPLSTTGALTVGAATAAAAVTAARRRPKRAQRAARVVRADGPSAAGAQSATSKLQETAETCLLNNYGKRGLAFVRGDGHKLYDADGREFLDFTAGIAVNCLGHSDAGWVEAVTKQAGKLVHTSNLYLNPEQVALGEKLVQRSFADKAFFCNSGTEANEAAIKFSRKFHVASGKPRERFISFENAFHGRTMGALALTWKEGYKAPFQPLMPSVDFLPFNDVEALKGIDESTCAVFAEPMQGEGGVVPADPAFLKALRSRCDEVGALLVFDEVQCGLGRTGKLFGYENSGVTPDLLTLAKPLAAGLPIGAVLLTEKIASTISPGDHGSTFAGAPLVCAAGNYTVDRISDPAFLANVQEMGERLRAGLRGLAEPRGYAVRGQGLLNGIVFEEVEACGAVYKAAMDLGLLVLTAGKGNVLRIAPALTVGPAEVDTAIEILTKAFAQAEAAAQA